jgi:hypothetical protein
MDIKFQTSLDLINAIELDKDNEDFCNSKMNDLLGIFSEQFAKPVKDVEYGLSTLLNDLPGITDIVKNNQSQVSEEIWPVLASVHLLRAVQAKVSFSSVPEFKNFHQTYGYLILK